MRRDLPSFELQIMASDRHSQASPSPSIPMSPSTSEPPSPSPHAGSLSSRPSLSIELDQFSTSDGYRPYGSLDSDSDSSSKDSLVTPASDRHSLYSDDPILNPELHPHSSKEKKSPRRVYFDYGITASSLSDSSSPVSLKLEDSQDPWIDSHPSLRSCTRFFTPTSHTFRWELPSPSYARSAAPHRVDPNDIDSRVESPSFYHSQPFWLVLYFCFNLGLTLYNKAVLIHFPYAYAVTALHALCGSIGGFALLRLGMYVPAKLTGADNMALFAFSLLYTINIAVSNLSLELVTIPVSPVDRCLVPFF